MGPPAELQHGVAVHHLGVEAAEGLVEIGPDQDRPGGHRQDVTSGVVLALVDLTRFHERHPGAEPVDRCPEVV